VEKPGQPADHTGVEKKYLINLLTQPVFESKLMAKIQFEVLIPEPSNAFIIRRQKQRVIYDEKEKKK
jgi:hypothetical protein